MTADRRDERVLVTGANGQDGTYLVRTLLADGHDVHGMCHSEAGAARLVTDFPDGDGARLRPRRRRRRITR